MKTTALIAIALSATVSIGLAGEKKAEKSLGERTVQTFKNETRKASDAVTGVLTDAKKVDVNLSDSHIAMDRTLTPGKTAFVVRNTGKEKHGFEIRGEGLEKKLMMLGPGEEKTLHLDLKPGSYEVFCPEKEHMRIGVNVR